MDDLSTRFGAWRAYRGLTLQAVADACGVTKQMISYVELGDCDIGVRKLSRICERAFKTDIRTFFGPLPKKVAA